ncbi:MAG: L-aspartate oxidase [Sulfuricellaceae bacterium]|nr:L-aspartate oxidase [Sulfuricellaceae bacterium]
MKSFDVAIIGSGLAGMTLALQLADHKKIGLITKRSLLDGASNWAQGGIAAVLGDDDSFASHIQDTLIAGDGLCSEDATRFVVEHGKTAIEWLLQQGVQFSHNCHDNDSPPLPCPPPPAGAPARSVPAGIGGIAAQSGEKGDAGSLRESHSKEAHSDDLHLTREGGHSHRRIVHAADATGAAVQHTLASRICAHPNITILENYIAVDLITGKKLGLNESRCFGLYALDNRSGKVETIAAQHVALASGGAGKVYLYTTNPDVAAGDGIAMGWRAGCRVANMEFIQFHPTCLYHPHAKSFLITEAVRGEGGLLKLRDGTRFMPDHDPRAELAPRDVVARAIDFEMKKRGQDCVYLDISHKPAAFLKEHFPNIYARCLELGIDITHDPIPVVPAAHYTCGGIMVDLRARTDIDNLYAIGEVSHTGLHGANRLASNSLLECIVFAQAAARDILEQGESPIPSLPEWDESRVTDADEEIIISHNWDELRRFMWDYVGIVRTNKRLQRAMNRIKLLQEEIDEYYSNFRITNDLIELRNLVQTAKLIVQSAMLRHESRGLHFSRDYPEKLPTVENTVLTRILHKQGE